MSVERLERLAAGLVGTKYTDLGRTPEQGFDCWGLYRWLRREAFGDDLPCYSDQYLNSKDQHAVAALIGLERGGWQDIAQAKARPGDMLVFKVAGQASHVGCLLTGPNFIHAFPGLATVCGTLTDPGWSRRKVETLRPETAI
ncbi:MAG: NlpC/P60 family protein [Alphaproteobacteria bacterium]